MDVNDDSAALTKEEGETGGKAAVELASGEGPSSSSSSSSALALKGWVVANYPINVLQARLFEYLLAKGQSSSSSATSEGQEQPPSASATPPPIPTEAAADPELDELLSNAIKLSNSSDQDKTDAPAGKAGGSGKKESVAKSKQTSVSPGGGGSVDGRSIDELNQDLRCFPTSQLDAVLWVSGACEEAVTETS
jgi:hypothetical protein